MIEVLFGEGEAGSMKFAKQEGLLKGKAEDVVCLGFLMDIGDIKEDVASTYRKELIYKSYAQEQWAEDEEADAELREAGGFYVHELERLRGFLEKGEEIRIWYSISPYSICGFYHLCHMLKGYADVVHVVELPKLKQKDNVIIEYRSWCEVCPEDFESFLANERKLTETERRMYADMWSELVEENSPLRAVINGRIVGVDESFYDFLIWKRLTEQPVKEARLIGDILGYYPIGIGDWWYAARIDYYIEQGQIKVVEDSKNHYARTICLME